MQIPCYLQLITLYIQQSSMGFEEMITYDFSELDVNQTNKTLAKPTTGSNIFHDLSFSEAPQDISSRKRFVSRNQSSFVEN